MIDKISRSEQKRRYKQVEAAATEIAELSNRDLEKFPGSEEVHREILVCRGLKGSARKRQIKYLAKVMRKYPLDDIYDFLSEIKGSALKDKQKLHEAERLRDVLINEAIESYQYCQREQLVWEPTWRSEILDSTVQAYDDLKEKSIRKIVYQYVKTRNRLHYRELFRMLKAAIETEDRKRKAL